MKKSNVNLPWTFLQSSYNVYELNGPNGMKLRGATALFRKPQQLVKGIQKSLKSSTSYTLGTGHTFDRCSGRQHCVTILLKTLMKSARNAEQSRPLHLETSRGTGEITPSSRHLMERDQPRGLQQQH